MQLFLAPTCSTSPLLVAGIGAFLLGPGSMPQIQSILRNYYIGAADYMFCDVEHIMLRESTIKA